MCLNRCGVDIKINGPIMLPRFYSRQPDKNIKPVHAPGISVCILNLHLWKPMLTTRNDHKP